MAEEMKKAAEAILTEESKAASAAKKTVAKAKETVKETAEKAKETAGKAKEAAEKAKDSAVDAVKKTTRKAPAKKSAAKTDAKKPAARKAAAKKTAEAPACTVILQYAGKEVLYADLQKTVQAIWKDKGHTDEANDIELYVKPEENMAYYVVNNGEEIGSFGI